MLTTFRFGSNEKHIREALIAALKRRGVDLAELDPSIRSIMVAAAFSTGVEEQVEAFIRLVRVAERFDLPDYLRIPSLRAVLRSGVLAAENCTDGQPYDQCSVGAA